MPSSVQELLLAAQAKKSPFIDLLEGVAGGFIHSQNTRAAREKIARDQAIEDENRARAKETHEALMKKLNGSVEDSTKDGFRRVQATPTPAMPGLRLTRVTQGSDGYLKPEFKDVTPKPATPQKAPPGFRWTKNGDQERIPGGPADLKFATTEAKKQSAQSAAVDQAELILAKVKQAEDLVGMNTVGWGAALKNVPGTEAKDLRSVVETLKANLGFEALAKMRANSPTGGALGNISDSEMRLLTAAVTSLEQSQSQAQFKANLKEVRTRYAKILNAMKQDNMNTQVNAAVQSAVQSIVIPGYQGEVQVEEDN